MTQKFETIIKRKSVAHFLSQKVFLGETAFLKLLLIAQCNHRYFMWPSTTGRRRSVKRRVVEFTPNDCNKPFLQVGPCGSDLNIRFLINFLLEAHNFRMLHHSKTVDIN